MPDSIYSGLTPWRINFAHQNFNMLPLRKHEVAILSKTCLSLAHYNIYEIIRHYAINGRKTPHMNRRWLSAVKGILISISYFHFSSRVINSFPARQIQFARSYMAFNINTEYEIVYHKYFESRIKLIVRVFPSALKEPHLFWNLFYFSIVYYY